MIRRNLVTGAILVAMSACGSGTIEQANVTTPSAAPIESGVGVIAEGCSLVAQLGSGVIATEPGRVVTAAHTIAGALTITVVDASGTDHAATVVSFDKDTDLAALDVPTLTGAPLDLATSMGLGAGSFISWSRDDGVSVRQVEITRRLVVTIEDIYVDETVERSAIEIVGDIRVGDSGGGVIDGRGDLVGIVYANSRGRANVGFASDMTEVGALLASTDPRSVDNGRCL